MYELSTKSENTLGSAEITRGLKAMFGNLHRLHKNVSLSLAPRRVFTQEAAEGAAPRPAVIQAENMARDV